MAIFFVISLSKAAGSATQTKTLIKGHPGSTPPLAITGPPKVGRQLASVPAQPILAGGGGGPRTPERAILVQAVLKSRSPISTLERRNFKGSGGDA
jgi:hypothetical protein